MGAFYPSDEMIYIRRLVMVMASEHQCRLSVACARYAVEYHIGWLLRAISTVAAQITGYTDGTDLT